MAYATPIIDLDSQTDKEANAIEDESPYAFYSVFYQEIGATTYGSELFSFDIHTELSPEEVGLLVTPLHFIKLQPTKIWADARYKASYDGTQGDLLDYELVAVGNIDFAPEWLTWRMSKRDYSNMNDWGFGLGFAYEDLWLGYLKNNAGRDRVTFTGYYPVQDSFAFVDANYLVKDSRFEGDIGYVFPEMRFLGGSRPAVKITNHLDDWIYSIGILVEWPKP